MGSRAAAQRHRGDCGGGGSIWGLFCSASATSGPSGSCCYCSCSRLACSLAGKASKRPALQPTGPAALKQDGAGRPGLDLAALPALHGLSEGGSPACAAARRSRHRVPAFPALARHPLSCTGRIHPVCHHLAGHFWRLGASSVRCDSWLSLVPGARSGPVCCRCRRPCRRCCYSRCCQSFQPAAAAPCCCCCCYWRYWRCRCQLPFSLAPLLPPPLPLPPPHHRRRRPTAAAGQAPHRAAPPRFPSPAAAQWSHGGNIHGSHTHRGAGDNVLLRSWKSDAASAAAAAAAMLRGSRLPPLLLLAALPALLITTAFTPCPQVKKSWTRSGAGFSCEGPRVMQAQRSLPAAPAAVPQRPTGCLCPADGWLASWYLMNSMFLLLTGQAHCRCWRRCLAELAALLAAALLPCLLLPCLTCGCCPRRRRGADGQQALDAHV